MNGYAYHLNRRAVEMQKELTNVQRAKLFLGYMLADYIKEHHQNDAEEWFHPCLDDQWVDCFADWLKERQKKIANSWASNE